MYMYGHLQADIKKKTSLHLSSVAQTAAESCVIDCGATFTHRAKTFSNCGGRPACLQIIMEVTFDY